jgi:hypothetical protein
MAKSLQQLADQAPAKTAELNELSAETMARRLTAIFDSARMD